jgi:hypothetical protein
MIYPITGNNRHAEVKLTQKGDNRLIVALDFQ